MGAFSVSKKGCVGATIGRPYNHCSMSKEFAPTGIFVENQSSSSRRRKKMVESSGSLWKRLMVMPRFPLQAMTAQL